MLAEDLPMSRPAVRDVERPIRRNVANTAAHGKCTPRCVASAAPRPSCHSYPAATGQYIALVVTPGRAATALAKSRPEPEEGAGQEALARPLSLLPDL